jgi:hypothetical protein
MTSRLRSLAGVALLGFVVAGCGVGASRSPVALPAESVGPLATVSAAVGPVRAAIAAALAPFQLQLIDATRAFRPSETVRLTAAPRAIYQALLADDPDGGFIVVYEFRDAAAAVDAGNDLAGYLGTGAGRINFPLDAQHTIRQLGTTLIFYTWAPSTSPDPGSPKVAEALATLGIGFAPPR